MLFRSQVKEGKKTTPTGGTLGAKDRRGQGKRSGWKGKQKTEAKGSERRAEKAAFYQEGNGGATEWL